MPSPIICALDTVSLSGAQSLCAEVQPYVGAIKLGLEFFCAHGQAGVEAIQKTGIPIFLDLKFHDIPNTVAGAIRGVAALKPEMLTLHAVGGSTMLEAAIASAHENHLDKTLLLGVTVLTSMDETALRETGITRAPDQQVRHLAGLANQAGLGGCVCSPHEISVLKAAFPKLKLVVPGIRPEGSAQGDQKRVMTPREAMDKGADYLVIGRPITQADTPAEAAKAILKSLG